MPAPETSGWRVCFVCSGNICRSPMAEVLLAHELREAGHGTGVEVISAGTLGIEDHPAAPHAVTCAAEAELDLEGHRSRGITDELVASCNVLIGMEMQHVGTVRAAYPALAERVFLFGSFPEPNLLGPEVDDPVGGDLEEFRVTFRELARQMPTMALEIAVQAGLRAPDPDADAAR